MPLEAVRVSDYTRPLAALGLKASIVVLDAARANPFAKSGKPLAGGLALAEPEPGTLIAFNAAPGTVAPEGQGPYGPYAQALAEMMREAGLPLADVFERTRLRVNDTTKGAEVPWHASRVQTPVVFFERGPDAPPPAVSAEQTDSMRSRPIRDLDAQQAYLEALDRDTLQGYLDFLAAYPDDPMAARVRAIVAARREAITWRRTRVVDTPDAYWSYLRRYPRGPHAADAERRLAYLAAALEPPPSFPMIDYDVPPPPPDESIYVDRPVLAFDDPEFGFAPPLPPPVYFLPPPSPDFILLPPPLPPVDFFVLPIPIYVPVPIWCEPPAYVRAAAEQRDLRQRPQQGRDQQHDEHRQNYQSRGPDDNAEGRASVGPARSRRANRYGSQRAGDRPGVATVGRAQGKHNAEQACAWEQHPGASDTTRTAAPPVRKAITGNGRPAFAASRRRAQDRRPGSQSAGPDSTRTTAAPVRKAVARNGRRTLAARGWRTQRRWSANKSAIPDATRTAAAPSGKAIAGNGRPAVAADGRRAQDRRPADHPAVPDATGTAAAPVRKAVAGNGRPAFAGDGWRTQGRKPCDQSANVGAVTAASAAAAATSACGVEAQRAGACCDVAAARRDAAGTATTRDDEAGTAAACDSAASTAATCRDAAAAGCRAPGAAAACREAASSAACGHAGAATCGQTGELRWATMPEMTAARIKRCFEP